MVFPPDEKVNFVDPQRGESYCAHQWRAGVDEVGSPEDVQDYLGNGIHAYATGGALEVKYRLRRKFDGAYRWQLGRAAPYRYAEGIIVR